MHVRTQKHKMPPIAVAFHFVRKLTCSEPNSVCVCRSAMPVMGYVDKVNLNSKQRWRAPTRNQWDSERRQWTRKRENVHSSTAYPLVYVCVCVHSCQCVFRHATVCMYGCVCCMNTAQWLVCEVTDSFITACAHRKTAPSRGRREEDRDTGQARFTVGLALVSPAVGGGRGGDSCCLL